MNQPREMSTVLEELADRLEVVHPLARLPITDPTLANLVEELRAAEEELRAARNSAEQEKLRYKELFEFAPDGYLVTNHLGMILEANRAAIMLLNRPGNFVLGRPLPVYIHGEDRSLLRLRLARLTRESRFELAVRLLPRDLAPIDVQVVAERVRGKDGIEAVRWMMRDISAQRKIERELVDSRQRLQVLTMKLTMVEEQERRRIANDIHDYISQTLAVSKLRLGLLRSHLCGEELAALDEVRELLSTAINQTRSLTFELSPPMLYELGLPAAIEELMHQRAAYGVQFDFDNAVKQLRLRREVLVTLFRAVRELLANVLKHSHATHAKIALRQSGRKLLIEVEDNGVGFNPAETIQGKTREGSIGLLSIRERLEPLGGELDITSAPGKGTRILLTAPLDGAPRRARRIKSTGKPTPKSPERKAHHATEHPHRRRSSNGAPGTAVAPGA